MIARFGDSFKDAVFTILINEQSNATGRGVWGLSVCVARKGDKNLCEMVGILRHLRRWSVFEALKTVRGLYTKLAVDFFKGAFFLPGAR